MKRWGQAIGVALAVAALAVFGLPAASWAQLGGLNYNPSSRPMLPGASPFYQSSQGTSSLRYQSTHQTPQNVIREAQKDMKEADPRMRLQGLNMVRAIHDPKVKKMLMKAITDPDIRVRVKACDMIAQRQLTEAVPVLTQYLFLRSTQPIVRLHVVAALGRIGDKRGAAPVMAFLKQADDERSRGTAAYALGEIGDPRARDLLSEVALNDKSAVVRRLAREALGKIDGEMPVQHEATEEKKVVTTFERLAKLRAFDAKLHAHDPHFKKVLMRKMAQ